MISRRVPDGPPYDFHPTAGLLSISMFAWWPPFSPNLANPPWFVDLAIDEDGELEPDVWPRCSANSNSRWAAEMAASGGNLDHLHGLRAPRTYLPPHFTMYFANDLDTLGVPYTCRCSTAITTTTSGSGWRSSCTYFMPLNATVEFSPRVLNGRHTGGRWSRASIELPGDLDVADIDTMTLAITQINGNDLEQPIRAGRLTRSAISTATAATTSPCGSRSPPCCAPSPASASRTTSPSTSPSRARPAKAGSSPPPTRSAPSISRPPRPCRRGRRGRSASTESGFAPPGSRVRAGPGPRGNAGPFFPFPCPCPLPCPCPTSIDRKLEAEPLETVETLTETRTTPACHPERTSSTSESKGPPKQL